MITISPLVSVYNYRFEDFKPLDFGIFEAFFESSLFAATHEFRKKFIDLGWYPMWEEEGNYVIELYNLNQLINLSSAIALLLYSISLV